jgi:hypothetical protein
MRQVLTTTALIVSFVFLPSHARAEQSTPPKGFRNYVWGVAPSNDLKKVSGPTDGVTMLVPAGSKKPVSLFDVPVAEEAFYFSNGKFYQGDAWLDGKGNFDKMIVALTKQYGPPSVASPAISQWKWKWSTRPVEVHVHYQEKFARTTVSFVNSKFE